MTGNQDWNTDRLSPCGGGWRQRNSFARAEHGGILLFAQATIGELVLQFSVSEAAISFLSVIWAFPPPLLMRKNKIDRGCFQNVKTPVAYFFDMDHTLINNDCDVSWKQFVVRHKLGPESDLAEAERYFRDYNAGMLDVAEFLLFQFREFIGKTPEQMRPLAKLHFEEYVRPHVYPEARKLVRSLLDTGFPVAILSSTNSVVAQPLAEHLGIREVYGTRLELVDNRYTGRIVGPYGAQEGKVAIAAAWAKKRGFTLKEFAYYGDSVNDGILLNAVGFPFAVNPSPELCALAREKGWPILHWTESLSPDQSSSMPKVSASPSRSTDSSGRISARSPEKSSDWSTPRSTKKRDGSSSSLDPIP